MEDFLFLMILALPAVLGFLVSFLAAKRTSRLYAIVAGVAVMVGAFWLVLTLFVANR